MSSRDSGRESKHHSKYREYDPEWDGESGYRIYISRLPYNTSSQTVRQMLPKYGRINEICVSSRDWCFAYVNFVYKRDAEKAIEKLSRKIFDDRILLVKWARDRDYLEQTVKSFYTIYDTACRNYKKNQQKSRSPSPRQQNRRRSRSPSFDLSSKSAKHSRLPDVKGNKNNEENYRFFFPYFMP